MRLSGLGETLSGLGETLSGLGETRIGLGDSRLIFVNFCSLVLVRFRDVLVRFCFQ